MKRVAILIGLLSAMVSFSVLQVRSDAPEGSRPGMAEGRDISDMSAERNSSARLDERQRDERIREGRENLAREARSNPSRVLEGITSLRAILSLEESVQLMRNHSVEIVHLFHTETVNAQVFIGGYPGDKDVDTLTERYERDQELMLESLIADSTAMVAGIANPDHRKALSPTIDALRQRLELLRARGIEIFGVLVRGPAARLDKLSHEPRVLVVESADPADSSLPLQPEGSDAR